MPKIKTKTGYRKVGYGKKGLATAKRAKRAGKTVTMGPARRGGKKTVATRGRAAAGAGRGRGKRGVLSRARGAGGLKGKAAQTRARKFAKASGPGVRTAGSRVKAGALGRKPMAKRRKRANR